MPKKPVPAGPAAKRKVHRVMHEYKHGELHSGSKTAGPVVRKRKQAVAIALSEARKRRKRQ